MDLNNLKSDPIVVVGGGFGGLSTVQALLAHSVGTPIILIDQSPRFLFKPFLYELLSGELQLWEVAPFYSALSTELGFIFLQECVAEVDEFERKLITSSGIELRYSQLVISTGLTTDFSVVEDLEEYAYGFSNLNDFQRIKQLITSINNSSTCLDPLVIAGAGPTGVELACKVADLVNNRVEIYLVDKGSKILSKSKSFNREKAIDEMARRNVKIYLDHHIKSVNESYIEISTEKNKSLKVNYSGLIWTAGLKPFPSKLLDPWLNENKKIIVNKFLQMNEFQNIFFLGDITFNEHDPFPSSAQVAMQQGFLTAQNIISLRKRKKLKSFEFEDLGEMLSLGIGNASITGYGITLAGPLAFEIRRLAYLIRIPGFSLSLKSTGSWLFSKKIINRLFSHYH
ncbi:NAD(P)/FAD-dependent oxidoreductase [Prochlorococcus marinus]|uniref:3-hydroxyacyl-CoA dehydrogenase n=1 Tax=Prochlorococcus marinus XMU1408 TaxID=2213228 RepID=A0A318R5V7_PROMR|nr:FAD-dependent oxidoreductase [Prochlorococcus marinus]MBW3041141.1 3-hydroxyacyl-CoA dehydrogenase [Prochlorococcus marinus str. XMU1408]PYE03739.1 3-hydroxyacyl-CoA dehydrogenase [Prochlorococcus marinus XMU1408]